MYSFIAGGYWYTISLLSTLQGLFRGRKFNTIRMRTDSTSFNVAEMYLGVMIVSIILFLLPTLAMFYYYVFMSVILFVMAIQLLLVFLQIIFTDFPYFLLAYSLTNPYALPAGIQFKMTGSQVRIEALKSGSGGIFYQMVREIKSAVMGPNFSIKEILKAIFRGKSLLGQSLNLLSMWQEPKEQTVSKLSQREFLFALLVNIIRV